MAYLRVSTEIILVFVRFAHAIGAVVRGCVTSARLSLALADTKRIIQVTGRI